MSKARGYKVNKTQNILVICIAAVVFIVSLFVIVKLVKENGFGIETESEAYQIDRSGKNYDIIISNMTDRLFEYKTETWKRVKVIHDIVAQGYKYTKNGYDNADDLTFYGEGNDRALSELFKDLCKGCGIDCDVVDGYKDKFQTERKTKWSWNAVYIDNDVYFVDVTMDMANNDYDLFLLCYDDMNGKGYDMKKYKEISSVTDANYEIYRTTLKPEKIEFIGE